MRRIYTLIIAALLPFMLQAQGGTEIPAPEPGQVTVGAVSVVNRGPKISVSYSLRFGEGVRSCHVSLVISTDGGETYSFHPDNTKLAGDFALVSTDGAKCIEYDATADRERLAGKSLDFKIVVSGKDIVRPETLIMATAGVFPQTSFGVMIGRVNKVGWYLKARSDFNSVASDISCNSKGIMENGEYIWTGGGEQLTRLVVSGGCLLHASRWLYPYAGVGYGTRQRAWETVGGNWANITDLSCSGINVEAGAIVKMGKLALSAGFSSTAFSYSELELGLGLIF